MNWMTKIKIIAKKILRCLMVGGICSIFEKVIAAIGIFDVFDKDLYCFTIDNVLLGIAFGEILFIIFILKVKTMLSLHILIKKQNSII